MKEELRMGGGRSIRLGKTGEEEEHEGKEEIEEKQGKEEEWGGL